MGDSLMTVISIMLAGVLIFVFPMMAMAERNDDVSLTTVQSAVVEFVDKVKTTGKMTQTDYDTLTQKIYATGNTYDIDLEVQRLDENPGKKTTANVQTNKVGENSYFSEFTEQIKNEIRNSSLHEIKLKEGDRVAVKVVNTNETISQMLKNFFYSLSGNNAYKIAAECEGLVMVDGK